MSLNITKTDNALSVRLRGATPELRVDESGFFTLLMYVNDDQVEIDLSPADMQTLGMLCVAHLPGLAPKYAVANSEDAYRHPARFIKEMDDRDMQLVIRELQCPTIVDFLWYMKDAELIRKILKNISRSAADMLMDDLSDRWHGKNPDTARIRDARTGRAAVEEMLHIIQRVVDEGQIMNYFGDTE